MEVFIRPRTAQRWVIPRCGEGRGGGGDEGDRFFQHHIDLI